MKRSKTIISKGEEHNLSNKLVKYFKRIFSSFPPGKIGQAVRKVQAQFINRNNVQCSKRNVWKKPYIRKVDHPNEQEHNSILLKI